VFPRLLSPDGSGATLAASSGARSSTNMVLVFGVARLVAEPMRRNWMGGLILV